MATSGVSEDKYRSYLSEEELKTAQWNAGPPNYDVVNKLFEEGRTKVWTAGSLEEQVQNLVKTWEMEICPRPIQMTSKQLMLRSLFLVSMVSKKIFSLEDIGRIGGSYNMFLQTSLPPALRSYDPDQETYESSQSALKRVFPRGFAVEILQLYSGPPVIAYKFRHWGYMEGPFQGYAPTGELVEFFGTAIIEMENSKVVKVEFFYDRGELLAQLIKGEKSGESASNAPSACPFLA
ncbi:Pathogen-related protein [Sesamum angolense]|uniref:Pathogen-related protein n=1 Tax=Sesamum angolense TaxID=2727404 RepID=A0AAE1WCS5_9LAMI|nr:Pathogen-related protein [Sesamum angolense]